MVNLRGLNPDGSKASLWELEVGNWKLTEGQPSLRVPLLNPWRLMIFSRLE
jgi:hypothetical protein